MGASGLLGWYDHGTRWTRDGRPYCLVGQPYGLSDDEVGKLAALRQQGLQVSIDTRPSWHYPGSVLTVVVTRDDCP
jgi:hypothetical protein